MIDWTKDPDFTSLPDDHRQRILNNYFDKELADDDFSALDNDRQEKIRGNFISSSLGKPKAEETPLLPALGRSIATIPPHILRAGLGLVQKGAEQWEGEREEIRGALKTVRGIEKPRVKKETKPLAPDEGFGAFMLDLAGKGVEKIGEGIGAVAQTAPVKAYQKFRAKSRVAEAMMGDVITPEVKALIKSGDLAGASELLEERRGYVRGTGAEEYIAKPVAEAARVGGKKLGELTAKIRPTTKRGSYKYYVTSAIEGVGSTMGPALAATIITKNPGIGMSIMFPQVFGETYSESRAGGMDVLGASQKAAFYAASEVLSEGIPLGILTKAGGKFTTRVLKGASAEGVQESVNEATQVAYDEGILDEHTPSHEIGRRLMEAGIIGAIGGGGMAVGVHAFTGKEEDATAKLKKDVLSGVVEVYESGKADEATTITSVVEGYKSGLFSNVDLSELTRKFPELKAGLEDGMIAAKTEIVKEQLIAAIDEGLATGKLQDQDFTPDIAIDFINNGLVNDIFTTEDIENFKKAYPGLRSGLNVLVAESAAEDMDLDGVIVEPTPLAEEAIPEAPSPDIEMERVYKKAKKRSERRQVFEEKKKTKAVVSKKETAEPQIELSGKVPWRSRTRAERALGHGKRFKAAGFTSETHEVVPVEGGFGIAKKAEAKPDLVVKKEIDKEAQEAATSEVSKVPQPTEAQIEAGNYKKGHVAIQGLDISIENPKGSERSGTAADGKKWSVTMKHHYGYIKGTVGKDKEHLDVFIGENPESETVFVIDQVTPDTRNFDEHKIIIGTSSLAEAKETYLDNYEKGWQGIGNISQISMKNFKRWIDTGKTKTPFNLPRTVKAGAKGEATPTFTNTESALVFGEKATPSQVEQLKVLQAEQNKKFEAARKAGDLQLAMNEAVTGQFYREAVEASEGKTPPTLRPPPMPEKAEPKAEKPAHATPLKDFIPRMESTKAKVGERRIGKEGYVDQLQRVKIEDIRPIPENKIFAATVEKYKKEPPAGSPLLMQNSKTGELTVDDGHHRIVAAKERGETEIDVWVRDSVPQKATHKYMVREAIRGGELTPEKYKELHEKSYGPLKKFMPKVEPAKSKLDLTKRYVEETGEKIEEKSEMPKVKAKYPQEWARIEEAEAHKRKLWDELSGDFRKNRGISEYTTKELEVEAKKAKAETLEKAKAKKAKAETLEKAKAKAKAKKAEDLTAAAYRKEGFRAKEANTGAVKDFIKDLEGERTDVVKQVKKLKPELFKAKKVTGKPIKDTDSIADAKLSAREEKRDRSLVAYHNLTAQNLIDADELGGMPMPSLAITKKEFGFESFGDITLIGNEGMVDPEGTANRVFDSDIFSPTIPGKERDLKKKQFEKIWDKLSSKISDVGDYIYSLSEKAEQGYDALLHYFDNSNGMKVAFLREQGIPIRIPQRDVEYRMPFSDTQAVQDFVKGYKGKLSDIKLHSPEHKAVSEAIKKGVDEAIERDCDDVADKKDIRKITMDTWFDEKGYAAWGLTMNRLGQDAKIIRKPQKEVDKGALRESLEKKFTKKVSADYLAWTKKQIDPLYGDPYIKLGRGKVPYTLENAFEAMHRQSLKSGQEMMTFGPGKARAMGAREFQTLDAARKHKAALVSHEKFQELKEEQDKKRETLTDALANYYQHKDWQGEVDVWASIDGAMNAVGGFLKSPVSKQTSGLMKSYLAKNGFKNVNSQLLKETTEFAKTLQNMPTEYFEVKPERIVDIGEFSGAALPKNVDPKVKEILKKRGVPFKTYKNDKDRQAVTASFQRKKGVLFSKRMFSALTRAAEAPKFPAKLPAKSVINQLKKAAGVKQVEIDVSGLAIWLEGKNKVTKDELVEFLRLNEATVEEAEKSEIGEDEEEKEEMIEERSQEISGALWDEAIEEVTQEAEADRQDEINDATERAIDEAEAEAFYNAEREAIEEAEEAAGEDEEIDYDAITAGIDHEAIAKEIDHEAIREEVEESFPEIDPYDVERGINADYIYEAAYESAVEEFEAGAIKTEGAAQHADPEYRLPGGEEGSYRELVLTVPAKAGEGVTYESSHFPGDKNPIAHMRGEEFRGEKGGTFFHFAEFQSDLYSRIADLEAIKAEAETEAPLTTWRLVFPGGQAFGMSHTTEEEAEAEAAALNADKESDFITVKEVVRQPELSKHDADELAKLKKLFPWGENWHELVAKKALEYAVNNGYSRITWDTAKTQVERWESALRKGVDEISWRKQTLSATKVPSGERVLTTTREARQDLWSVVDDAGVAIRIHLESREAAEEYIKKQPATAMISGIKDGQPVFGETVPLRGQAKINGQRVTLTALVGKEIANQIRESSETKGSFEGKDLTIGGEFYRILYDQKMPGFLKKYGKKWGAKVTRSALPGDEYSAYVGPELTTEELKALDRNDFTRSEQIQIDNIYVSLRAGLSFSEGMTRRGTKSLAEKLGGKFELQSTGVPVHSMEITPEMAESIKSQGQPLFAEKEDEVAEDRLTVQTAKDEVAKKIGEKPLAAMLKSGKIGFLTIDEAIEVTGSQVMRQGVQGFYLEGITYLIPESIDKGRAWNVLMHELGVHHGYQKIFGENLARRVFDSFAENAGATTPLGKAVDEAISRVPRGTPANWVNEEAVAYFCENNANAGLPLYKKIMARMRLWAVKYFGCDPSCFTHDDYVALATSAIRGEVKTADEPAAAMGVKFSGAAEAETRYSKREQKEISKFSVDKTMSIENAVKIVKANPNFQKWFGEGKVENLLYHGTTKSFTVFKPESGEAVNYLGSATYLTSSVQDAQTNYMRGGPDLGNRIERLSEEIYGGEGNEQEMANRLGVEVGVVEAAAGNYEAAHQLAEEDLQGEEDILMPVFTNMSNPFVMEPGGGTILRLEIDWEHYKNLAKEKINREDYESDDEYNEVIEEEMQVFFDEDPSPRESGSMVDFRNSIEKVGYDLGQDGTAIWQGLYETLDYPDEVTGQEIFDTMRMLDPVMFMEGENGGLMGSEFIRLVIEDAGYDGIQMDADHANKAWAMDIEPGTTHYAVFKAEQIKSLYNEGDFSREEKDIRYSEREKVDLKKWADDLIKGAEKKGVVMDREEPTAERLKETTMSVLAGLKTRKLDATAQSVLDGMNPKGKGIGQTIEKWIASPEWYQHPVLKKVVGHALDKSAKFHTLFNEFNMVDDPMAEHDTVAKTLEALARKGKISKAAFILGKTSSDFKKLETLLDDADVYAEKHTPEELKKEGYSADVIQAWQVVRDSYDRQLEARLKPMKDLIANIEEEAAFNGIEKKDIVYPDFGQYVIAGKSRRLNLKEAMLEMGSLKGTYSPRLREPGKYIVTGRKPATVVEGGDDRVRLNRRSKITGNLLRDELKRQGYIDVKVEKESRLPEETFQAVRLAEMGAVINRAATKGLDKYDTETRMAIMDEVMMDVSNTLKSRGSRSIMIRRRGGKPVKGYITNPLIRYVRYTGNNAAGIAKAEMAGGMIKALYGEYVNGEKVGGLDAAKEGEIHSLARSYIEEMLRNTETGDKIVGVLKGITTLKFLGFNPRSIMVNLTSLATSVPITLHTRMMKGKGSLLKVGKFLSAGCKDYTLIMGGKKLKNTDEQVFIDSFRDEGYADAQYTRDATGVLQGSYGTAWSKLMGGSMYAFGKSEEWVRGGTALTAYRIGRKQGMDHKAASEEAIKASNEAHGIYAKETLPMGAWGKGVGRLGQAFYTYMKFPHNYLQMLYDTGIRKKNIKGVIYGLAAPAVLGGVAAVPMYSTAIAIANALLSAIDDDRDAEKFVYDTINEHLGQTAEETIRGGILGIVGVDITGSLSMGPGSIPTSLWELTGAVGGMIEDVSKGVKHATTGEYGRAAEKLLPKAVGNIFIAWREVEGAVTSRGNRIWDEDGQPYMPTVSETVKKGLGFRSARRALLAQTTWVTKREERRFKETRDSILQKVKFLTGDGEDVRIDQDIADRISEFNTNALKTSNVSLITPRSIEYQLNRMETPTTKQKARATRSKRAANYEGSIWAGSLGVVEGADATQLEVKRLSDAGLLSYSSEPSRNIDAGYGVGVKLDDEQYSRYVADTSALIKTEVDRFVESPDWEEMDDKKKAFIIKRIINKGRKIVRDRLKQTILNSKLGERQNIENKD